MAFQHVASGTGTDQDLLDLARAALARVLATGKAYTTDGQSLTLADVGELRATINELEQKIAAAAGTAGPADNHFRMKRAQ